MVSGGMMDQAGDQAGKPQRVESRNEEANVLLGDLRSWLTIAARSIANLGDKLEIAQGERDDLQEEFALRVDEGEAAISDLAKWRDALEDYRRGLLSRDELLERTVGRG